MLIGPEKFRNKKDPGIKWVIIIGRKSTEESGEVAMDGKATEEMTDGETKEGTTQMTDGAEHTGETKKVAEEDGETKEEMMAGVAKEVMTAGVVKEVMMDGADSLIS